MYSKLDLHTHTIASDGAYTPRQVVEIAVARGLQVLAITDHDSTEGLAEAAVAARGTLLEVWPGVELSTDIPGSEVHILGYRVDPALPLFQQKLRQLRESRVDRAHRMLAKLAEMGMPVSWQRIQEIAGEGSIGRPHIAQALCENGFVTDPADAFNRFIGRNCPAYVERFRLTPEEAVRLILSAKGIPALAHPVIPNPNLDLRQPLDCESLLPSLVAAGLTGIEVYYPGYNRALKQRLLRLADRWQLIATGGSDFHGRGALSIGVGEVDVPEHVITRLRERYRQQGKADEETQRQIKKSA